MAKNKNKNKNKKSEFAFVTSPYSDDRSMKCVRCERKTGQRKLPLYISVNMNYVICLNYTCRICASCKLLFGNKHQIEEYLTTIFLDMAPEEIGNEYVIVGIVPKTFFRENKNKQVSSSDFPHDQVEIFKDHTFVIRTMRGWFKGPAPEEAPHPSVHWVKQKNTDTVSEKLFNT